MNNIESSPGDNGGELLKVKITLDKLLGKYMCMIMKDQEYLEMLDTSKPESYKGDPEDLERFLRWSENVWALECHRCKKEITRMWYIANPTYRNENDRYGDSIKWYTAYHPKINLVVVKQLPVGAKVSLDPVWSTWNVFPVSRRVSFAAKVHRE